MIHSYYGLVSVCRVCVDCRLYNLKALIGGVGIKSRA